MEAIIIIVFIVGWVTSLILIMRRANRLGKQNRLKRETNERLAKMAYTGYVKRLVSINDIESYRELIHVVSEDKVFSTTEGYPYFKSLLAMYYYKAIREFDKSLNILNDYNP